MASIYQIINTTTHKRYIGCTVRKPKERWFEHRSRLRHGKHENKRLQNAWNKYGESQFEFSVVETVHPVDLADRELYYIELYDSFNNGYNMSLEKGNICLESKEQLSSSVRGKNHWLYGKQHSEETKKRIGEAQTGKRHWNYGKATPSDVREKIQEGNKGKHIGSKNSSAKLTEEQVKEIFILHHEDKKLNSQSALGRRFGVSQALISSIVRGKTWTHITKDLETRCGL